MRSRLEDAGLDVGVDLTCDSVDARLTFAGASRDGMGGRGHHSARVRAALVLSIGPTGVRAGLEVPPSSARPAALALAEDGRSTEIRSALEALPEQFDVSLAGDASPLVAPVCSLESLGSVIARMGRENRPLWIGWTVAPDVAVHHATLLDEQLTDSLVVLARMLVLLGGQAGAVRQDGAEWGGAAEEAGPRQKERSARPTRGDSRRSHAADDDRGPEGRLRRDHGSAEALHDPARDRAPRGPRRRELEGTDPAGDASPARPAEAHPLARSGGRAVRAKASPRVGAHRRHDVVERGAQVRVLGGPFAGKIGIVQEVDGRGGARVMMGLLAVRFDLTNLEVHIEGRRRPVLSTSHRKPVSARS